MSHIAKQEIEAKPPADEMRYDLGVPTDFLNTHAFVSVVGYNSSNHRLELARFFFHSKTPGSLVFATELAADFVKKLRKNKIEAATKGGAQ